MKRALILLLLLLVLAALALPAAIGGLLQDQAETALRERWPDAEVRWQRGWTRSSVEIEADEWRGRIDIRQLPLNPPGLLALSGRITLAEPAATIDLDGRVGAQLRLQLQLDSAAITLQTQALWQWHAPRLVVNADRRGRLSLDLESRQLQVHDGLGNRLTLERPRLRLRTEPQDSETTSIDLQLDLSRIGQAPSRLVLQAESVDRQALAELLESGRELSRSEPESAAAGVAAIGALGAWQQLLAGGLQLRVAPLELESSFRLESQWQPAKRRLQLVGGGPEATLLDWAGPIIGLQQEISPTLARERARELLGALEPQHGIVRAGGELKIDIERP